MNPRATWRHAAKALHEIASMGFVGALVACLLINQLADRTAPAAFASARSIYAALADYVLIPSMAVVVVSGLLAMVATRAYLHAGWAWVKTLLGVSVFEATLMVVGAARTQVEVAAAAVTVDATKLDALLRAERNTLLALAAISIVNVVLAVWRPKLVYRVR